MKTTALVQLFRELNQAEVSYVVVGGYAVIAHGHLRATHDVDLVVDVRDDQPSPWSVYWSALVLHREPRLPWQDFADPHQRAMWREQYDADVLSVVRMAEPIQDELDIFLEPPFDIDVERKRALWQPLPDGLSVPFVAKDTLIEMKRRAGRAIDLDDIRALEDPA